MITKAERQRNYRKRKADRAAGIPVEQSDRDHQIEVRYKDTDPSWRAEAACRNMNPAVFFGLEHKVGGRRYGLPAHVPYAKAVCVTCPVIGPCREFAMAAGPGLLGVYGGLSEQERRRYRRSGVRV